MGEDIDILKILNIFNLKNGVKEQFMSILKQNGVWDGNLISKNARDTLVAMNLVSRYEGFNFPNWRTISLIGSMSFDIKHEVGNNRDIYKQ